MRKVLLICPEFHGTEHKILDAINKNKFHCSTIFYEEKEYRKNKIFLLPLGILKTASELFKIKLLEKKYWEYWHSITFDQKKIEIDIDKKIKVLNSDYEIIFIIKGLGLSKHLIREMKDKFHKAKFILYQWDSIERIPSVLEIYPFFDKIFSFEVNPNSNIFKEEYLPMFTPSIEVKQKISMVENSPEIDFLFVGKFTFQRMAKLFFLAFWCLINKKKYFFRLVHGIKFLKKISWLVSSNIDNEEYHQLMMKSKIIIEICHKGQRGYTQRIGESLSANKLVITNNEDAIRAFKGCGVYPIKLKHLNNYLEQKAGLDITKINNRLISPTSWFARIIS